VGIWVWGSLVGATLWSPDAGYKTRRYRETAPPS